MYVMVLVTPPGEKAPPGWIGVAEAMAAATPTAGRATGTDEPALVVVAAEMIAGRDGLGFAVWDARNGLRIDLLAADMGVIGILGMVLDRVLVLLTRIPSVAWGYER